MIKGLVSVIIPSKNRPEFLIQALESVFAQTYKKIEVIVVDDGSRIPLAPVLAKTFGGRVRCVRQDYSKGAPAARNAGIANATGEFVAFLDDDDLWLSEKLEKQIALFLIDKEIGLVFCGESIVCNGTIVKNRPAFWVEHDYSKMLFSNVVGGTSVVVVKKNLLDFIVFDESLPSCQDWDLFLRLALITKFGAISQIMVHRVVHGSQISSSLSNRIAGREKFFCKHKNLFDDDPLATAQFLRRMGSLKVLNHQRVTACCLFRQAFDLSPLDWRNFVCVFVGRYFPEMIAIRVLSKYSVTKIGDYSQFH